MNVIAVIAAAAVLLALGYFLFAIVTEVAYQVQLRREEKQAQYEVAAESHTRQNA